MGISNSQLETNMIEHISSTDFAPAERASKDRIYQEADLLIELPLLVQLQIFNRSFSTKGKGRGTGTYSMKLLTKRYLKG